MGEFIGFPLGVAKV